MKITRRTSLLAAVAFGAASIAAMPALADYPDRPITLIVPYGPGGGTDLSARVLANEMEDILGQPVVVENVAGGGGAVGLTRLFNSEPDGYMIGVGTGSNTTIAPHAIDVGYDPLEFTYLAGYYGWTYAVLVHPSLPVNSVAELAEWGRNNPGGIINSTSGGYGIHDVAMALFAEAAGGIDYRTLPNSSAAETTMRLLAGDANLTFGSPATNLPHVHEGSIKALGVVSDLIDPALEELDLEMTQDALGFSLINRTVVLAPPGLPEDVRATLEAAIEEATTRESVQERLAQLSLPLAFKPGNEALEEVTEIYHRYGEIIERLMAAEQ